MTSEVYPTDADQTGGVNMAAMGVAVERLLSVWSSAAVRSSFPWLFLFVSSVGSILKELQPVPQSYFSSSKNFVNLYFVKLSWGWTLFLLVPFLILFFTSVNKSPFLLAKRLSALVVATAVWYVCTETFLYIEDWTGSCVDDKTSLRTTTEFTSKAACRRAGFHWQGLDISGHSFLLTYSSLLIMEETSPMVFLKTANIPALSRSLLNLLYVAANLILVTWIWMFACTSVYFHDARDKLLGTLGGLSGWYLTYRYWYLKPFSPGLPPQRQLKEQKQHA